MKAWKMGHLRVALLFLFKMRTRRRHQSAGNLKGWTKQEKCSLTSETLALSEAADTRFLVSSLIEEIFRLNFTSWIMQQ